MHLAAVVRGPAGVVHRARNLVADRDLLQILRGRGVDLDAQVPDEAAALQQASLGVFALDHGAHDRLSGDGMDQITGRQFGDVHLEHPGIGIVDVDLHLLVVDGLLRIRGDVDRRDRAVGLEHLEPDDFHLRVRELELEAQEPVVVFADLREHLHKRFILGLGGSVGPIRADKSLVDDHFVAAGLAGRRDPGCRRLYLCNIQARPAGALIGCGSVGADDADERQNEHDYAETNPHRGRGIHRGRTSSAR